MRRGGAALAVATVLGACLAVAATPATSPGPTRLQVVSSDFSFALSRLSVPPGPAIVELVNFGQDPHDLRLQRVGGGSIARMPDVQPGAHYDLSVTLKPGRYRLWTTLGSLRVPGMGAVLVVRRPAKRG